MKTIIHNSDFKRIVLVGCLLAIASIYSTVLLGQRKGFLSVESGVSFVRSHTKDFGTTRLHKPYVNFSTPFIHVSVRYGQCFRLNKYLDLKCSAGLDFGGYRYKIYNYVARDSYTVGRNQIYGTLLIQSVFDPHIFDKNILKYSLGLQLFGNLMGFWKDSSPYDYFTDATIHPILVAPRLDIICDLGAAKYSLTILHTATPILSTSIQNNYYIGILVGVNCAIAR